MKKLLLILSIMIMASILLVPNQAVLAEVSVTHPTGTSWVEKMLGCERFWTDGGVTHLRNCVVIMGGTSSDPRLVGTTILTLSRNVFSDGITARGHGKWVLDAENVPDGYWAGTFTANVDNSGFMTVNLRGKGYGTLKGLLYEITLHSMGGEGAATLTELPSYDGP